MQIFWKHIQTKVLILAVFFGMLNQLSYAQSQRLLKKANKASGEFAQKASVGTDYKFKYDTVVVDPHQKKLRLVMNESFSYIPFRPENAVKYNQEFKHLLGRRFRDYSVSIESMAKKFRN